MSPSDANPIKTMQRSSSDAQGLIEQIERAGSGMGPGSERRGVRVRYQANNLSVDVTHPNGAVTNYVVIPRNLSTRGFAFIHGRFIYVGSRCRVALVTLDGETLTVDGKVVDCRHITGITHEVAVHFTSPIDLRNFVELEEDVQDRAVKEYATAVGRAAQAPITPNPQFLGSVLVVDGFGADRELLRMKLGKLGLTVVTAQDTDTARDAMSQSPFNLLMVDLSVSGDLGLDFIKALRAESYARPIIAMSTDDASQVENAVNEAGAQAYLDKPIAMSKMIDAIGRCLGEDGAPVVSSLRDDADMQPLIQSFVDQAQQFAEQLESALTEDDLAAITMTARQLKGSGSSYGFDLLTQVAQQALHQVAEQETEKATDTVRELINIVRRLSV